MASFTVSSGKCVQYDGKLKYGGSTTYTVLDTYDNYVNSLVDVAAGNITIVTPFTNNVNMTEQLLDVEVDFSDADAKTIATHRVFEVTGAVRMKLWNECTENLVGSANTVVIAFGTGNGASGFIAGTSAELIDAGEVWCASTAPAKDGAYSTLQLDKFVVSSPVGYEIATAELSTGAITFHCAWTPLDATGAVTVGNLSTMA